MKNNKVLLGQILVIGLVIMISIYRILPHPLNFTPMGAVAIFSGVFLSNRWFSFLLPVLSVWISDLIINNLIYNMGNDGIVWFYEGFYWQYICYVLAVLIGMLLSKQLTFFNTFLASLSSSMLFFIISNFGVWISSGMYAKTWSGLIECYIMAIPFYQNSMAGDVVFCAIIFGMFQLLQSKNVVQFSHVKQ